MINESGAGGGIEIGRETKESNEGSPSAHFANHKSHMTWFGKEPDLPTAVHLSCVTFRLGVDWVQFVPWFMKLRFTNCAV
jgi:hypothetical protein